MGVCEILAAVTTQDYIVFLTKPALLLKKRKKIKTYYVKLKSILSMTEKNKYNVPDCSSLSLKRTSNVEFGASSGREVDLKRSAGRSPDHQSITPPQNQQIALENF